MTTTDRQQSLANARRAHGMTRLLVGLFLILKETAIGAIALAVLLSIGAALVGIIALIFSILRAVLP